MIFINWKSTISYEGQIALFLSNIQCLRIDDTDSPTFFKNIQNKAILVKLDFIYHLAKIIMLRLRLKRIK